MATLATAQAKWERKTAAAGDKWKRRTTGREADYCKGFSDFVGHPLTEVCANYAAGVNAVSAADYNTAVAGKGAKWAQALRDLT
jgi:hypothetical protein